MRRESVILSFIAVVVGIVVAGGAFYLYQTFRFSPPQPSKTISLALPTPTPKFASAGALVVDSPADETVTDRKIVTVTGKTQNTAMVILTTAVDNTVLTPAADGSFSGTVNIKDDENILQITAISQNGETTKIIRTITYSTETF